MAFLLDTNICVYLMKKQLQVLNKFESSVTSQIFVSSISVAELEYGVANSKFIERNAHSLKEFLRQVTLVDFDLHAAYNYGAIRVQLEKQGSPIGSNDMLIAAVAKSLDLTLVTNNEREFQKVEGLRIENWTRE